MAKYMAILPVFLYRASYPGGVFEYAQVRLSPDKVRGINLASKWGQERAIQIAIYSRALTKSRYIRPYIYGRIYTAVYIRPYIYDRIC